MSGCRSVALIFILLFMILVPAGVLFASGAAEDRVSEAEKLVEDKQYNEALLLLTDMLKDDPSRLDDVQVLLSRIRVEKERYNDRYDDLIATYGGDEVEAAYPIIKDLEEMDPNPNEATRISLVLARETAGFVFNNNRWTAIMNDAAEQIAAGEYDGAIRTYMTGFDLSRDIFNDAGYGNIVVNDVYSRADRMTEDTEEFLGLYPQLVQGSANINSSFSDRALNGFISDSEALYPMLDQAAALRESLKDYADYFLIQEDSIRKTQGDDKQVHYLVYLDRLLNGRTTVEEREGITGVIEIFWNEVFDEAESNSVKLGAELFDEAYGNYSTGNLGTADAGFSNTITAAESSLNTIELGRTRSEGDAAVFREGLLIRPKQEIESDRVYMQTLLDSSELLRDLIVTMRQINRINDSIAGLKDAETRQREEGALIRQQINELSEEVETGIRSSEEQLSSIESQQADIADAERSIGIAGLPVEEGLSQRSDVLESEITLASMMAEIDLNRLENDYSSAVAAVEESRQLIEGVAGEAGADDDLALQLKFPDQALQKLLQTENTVETLVEGIKTLENSIDSERTEIRRSEPLTAAASKTADLLNRSNDLLERAGLLGGRAREQIFTAEKLRQEGERRIEESRILTQRAQFQAAKERLEAAAQKFDESLSYLEDAVLRNYRDNEIPRLYEEIQVAENNLVVRQVREYLTQGKASYSQGNFAAAQSVLIKAQSRWSDTNVEPNNEVEYWLTLTQTALSVTSGRVIAATDPLYAEMSQYLNQAHSDFSRAQEEYTAGREAQADIYFARAEQSLLFVQQYFPFNEEARVLNLRISQYRDPERFNEIFKSDFQTARRLISSNPQKAYIDLKDLEAINPSYPGLKTAITESEYAAGIKVRPPDPQKLARSAELYQLAYNIVSRNIRSEFNVALSYLDEAIELNPDNIDAIRLKDRISADVGGTATVVMSNADQQLYQEAVNEYTAGNYLKARIIVEKLLSNPDNQKNTKLLELKERIDRTR